MNIVSNLQENNLIELEISSTVSCNKQVLINIIRNNFSFFQEPFYWVDTKNNLLGYNANFLKFLKDRVAYQYDPITLENIYSCKEKKKSIKFQNKVFETGCVFSSKEVIGHKSNKVFTIHSTKMPLYNLDRTIVGLINFIKPFDDETGSMAEYEQQHTNPSVMEHLWDIANTIPIPFYWSDLNFRSLGMNDLALEAIGVKGGAKSIIGKTNYDIYPKKIADKLTDNQRNVIKNNKPLTATEMIRDVATGKIKHYEATISPLHNSKGDVIGIYGVSMDITALKEAEQLRLKNQAHQIESEQQVKFKRIVSQAVHDINSPLATMRMILSSCADKIPERPRVALHQVAGNIQAISGGLLENWSVKKQRQEKYADTGEGDAGEPIILAAIAFSEVLSNKRFEHQKLGIQLRDYVLPSSYFTMIHGDVVDFKRMLSNLINNAAGAYESGRGEIRCTLMDKDDQVVLCVSDKGKGIPEDVLNKIRQAIRVSSGKEEGHGIGFTQIHDTVKQLQGSIDIQSTVGKGTQINLSFPCISKPDWLADSLTVRSDDTIVVLDDDESIHQAWKDRFQQSDLQPYLDKHTVHFTQGQEAVDYINQVEDKDKLFLLTDYELLKQPLNGIQVIEKTGLKRTVLVTSHHDDIPVRKAVFQVGTQLLPKQLAHEVPIHIDVAPQHEQQLLEDIIAVNRDRSMLGTKKVGF